jgi:hypothetical protein
MSISILLSKTGDSLTITRFVKDITSAKREQQIIKTRRKVLNYLTNIQSLDQYHFWHENSPLDVGHSTGYKESDPHSKELPYHECSLSKLIIFVRNKIYQKSFQSPYIPMQQRTIRHSLDR